LGRAPLTERLIKRGSHDWIFGIHERSDVSEPELRQDAGGRLLLAEREQEMLRARPGNATG
jgi:hypothetical protein